MPKASASSPRCCALALKAVAISRHGGAPRASPPRNTTPCSRAGSTARPARGACPARRICVQQAKTTSTDARADQSSTRQRSTPLSGKDEHRGALADPGASLAEAHPATRQRGHVLEETYNNAFPAMTSTPACEGCSLSTEAHCSVLKIGQGSCSHYLENASGSSVVLAPPRSQL